MRYDPSRSALYDPASRPPLVIGSGWDNYQRAGEFARQAYAASERGSERKQAVDAAIMRAGFCRPHWFGDRGAGRSSASGGGFAVLSAAKEAFVVFRGTRFASLSDLQVNADIALMNWDRKGRVHRGYSRALDRLVAEIEGWLDAASPSHLTVTGHSLGGGLATLFAARYAAASLVTFGSPRVGDAAFCRLVERPDARRYVDTADIVARIPPALLGYEHAGALYYIDRHGTIHANGVTMRSYRRDRLRAAIDYLPLARHIRRNVLLRSLADHAPINYVSALLGRRAGVAPGADEEIAASE